MNHTPTPTPWRYVTLGSEGCRIYPDHGDLRTRGAFIACVNGRQVPEDQANAALIVKAVNSYEAMKAALESAKDIIVGFTASELEIPVEQVTESDEPVLVVINKALALANGKDGE